MKFKKTQLFESRIIPLPKKMIASYRWELKGPILLTWINFYTSMDKYSYI